MSDISSAVQTEVARIREMIATTKALIPNGRGNFIFYEMAINEAEKAIREQDTVTLIRILPELQQTQ